MIRIIRVAKHTGLTCTRRIYRVDTKPMTHPQLIALAVIAGSLTGLLISHLLP